MKILLILISLWSGLGHAQNHLNVRFLESQRSTGSPFSLPISMNDQGEVAFFGNNNTKQLSFQPTVHFSLGRSTIQYSRPVTLNRFQFLPPQEDLGWIEVKQKTLEYGMGISTIIDSASSVGILPYKGSTQTMIRYKDSQSEASLPIKMPTQLSDLESWNNDDHGSFQTFGGISAYASLNAGFVKLVSITVGFKNHFRFEIKKQSQDSVLIKISEEDIRHRQANIGPVPAMGTFALFNGLRLTAEFKLNLTDALHHELFLEALKGNIAFLQENLPVTKQKISWTGKDREFYFGIPLFAGQVKSKSHYDLDEESEKTELDVLGKKNKGFFVPQRNDQDFVYQTDENIILVWSSEMNKVKAPLLDRRFYSKGRILGLKGFDRELPQNTDYGTVVSQIGLSFSKKEAEAVRDIDIAVASEHLRSKCEEEQLACKNQYIFSNLVATFQNTLKLPWTEMRGELGLLFIKQPALIYAVVKTLKFKKEVYFKFLSEKFQSLEGTSSVGI